MANDSIMSMIAGFLPPSSGPPQPPPSAPPTRKRLPAAGGGTAGAGGNYGGPAAFRRQAAVVHMICFSKNRAFQLDQLLESSKTHLQLAQEKARGCREESGGGARLRISVLYLASVAPADVADTAAGSEAAPDGTPPASGTIGAQSSTCSSRTMEESYHIVRQRHPDVRFVRERPGEFCDQLCSLVGETGSDEGSGQKGDEHELGGKETFVMFAVDDMFFYRDFELPSALRLLSSDPSTFCVHLRLHPGITWSHTAGSPCDVPPLSPTGREVVSPQEAPAIDTSGDDGGGTGGRGAGRGDADDERRRSAGGGASDDDGSQRREPLAIVAADFGLLTFSREEGTGEWNYPWDLTGGLYRRSDAVAVVDGIVGAYGKEAAANPNLLEYHGHALLLRKNLPQHPGSGSGTGSTASASPGTAENVHSAAMAGLPAAGGGDAADAAADAAAAAAPALCAAAAAASAAPRCGCPGKAVVSSLAVNRVQSTYLTPVYACRGAGVRDLNRRLWLRRSVMLGHGEIGRLNRAGGAAASQSAEHSAGVAGGERGESVRGRETQRDVAGEGGGGGGGEVGGGVGGRCGGFDGQAYRRRMFNSVHVGELWFAGGDAIEGRQGDLPANEATTSTGRKHEIGAVGKGRASDLFAEPQHGARRDTLTVLLPVKNGGDHLLDAVESVLYCARELPPGWGVELLIVDDGSEDGAVERAVAAAAAAAGAGVDGDFEGASGGEHVGWLCNERKAEGAGQGRRGDEECPGAEEGGAEEASLGDAASGADAGGDGQSRAEFGRMVSRGGGGSTPPSLSEGGRTLKNGAWIRVLRHERTLGLAESLNEGLREARGDLVARMDADDVCMPGRFKEQVAFMLAHQHVSVLGASVATFSGRSVRWCGGDRGCADQDQQRPQQQQQQHQRHPKWQPGAEPRAVYLPVSGVQRIARHPTDPEFLAWSMLFCCCLAHPSVVLRRDRVLDAGGYDRAAEPAEDYDLWLRMESSAPGCVASLGEVLLGLRKHERNVSRQRRTEQREAADAAAARAMTQLLQKGGGRGPREEVTLARAAVVRRPESAASAEELAEAARLLGDLGAAAAAAAAEEEEKETGGPAGVGAKDSPKAATHNPGRDADRQYGPDNAGDHPLGEKEEQEEEEEKDGDSRDTRRRGADMVARDVEARLGAMAVHAMGRFGAAAAPVLAEWKRRFPDRPLLFALG